MKKDNRHVRLSETFDFKIAVVLLIMFAFSITIAKVIDDNFSKEEVERPLIEESANYLVNAYAHIVCAQVTDVNHLTGIVTFTDEDGEMWVVEAEGSDLGTYNYRDNYCIFFDRMGTDYLYDDEVVKVWKEVG